MVRDLLGEPDSQETFRTQYGCCVTRYNYSLLRVKRAEKRLAFTRALALAQTRALAQTPSAQAQRDEERRAKFARRYSNPSDALPAACAGLLSLNRYAKHATCSRNNREEIYRLKTGLLHRLIDEGLLVTASLHRSADQLCDRCGGSGTYYTETYTRLTYRGHYDHPYVEEYDATCRRCQGSRRRKGRTYYVLRFAVAGQTYCWHTPQDEFGRVVPLTDATPATYDGAEEKPLEMSRSRFAEVKALLRWVIGQKLVEGEEA